MTAKFELYCGDWIESLKKVPDGIARMCVTSPPYYRVRDYGMKKQLGHEETPQEYVDKLVLGFAEARRILTKDGTLWLNIGDCYAAGSSGGTDSETSTLAYGRGPNPKLIKMGKSRKDVQRKPSDGMKAKDLIGIPWMTAFAMRAAGWFLRAEIIWHKDNVVPFPVRDRPVSSHEQIFLFSKSPKYYYDYKAIREPAQQVWNPSHFKKLGPKNQAIQDATQIKKKGSLRAIAAMPRGGNTHHDDEWKRFRERRDVWTIPTRAFRGEHVAPYPEKLVELCVLAGSAEGDIVIDPFLGSGTTGAVALRLGRKFVGCELSPKYLAAARRRIEGCMNGHEQRGIAAMDETQWVQLV